MSTPPSVVIIGAGLGGMSAAVMLSKAGMRVTLLEKNERLGGKLNLLETEGFRFDLGPSIFTLPQVFRPLFESENRKFEDYVQLRRVDPQWRNFFEDGKVIDLWEHVEDMRAELAKLPDGAQAFEDYARFAAYSREQYHAIERGYLREGLDGFWELIRFYGLIGGRELDWSNSMKGGIDKRVRNPYLRDILAYFIKYVGSSAYDAPGFMNLMPNIQFEFGLWYVQGGLYELARAFDTPARRTARRRAPGRRSHSHRTQRRSGYRRNAHPRKAPSRPRWPLITSISNMEVIPADRAAASANAAHA